jgi:hypothetical protein
MRFLLGLFDSTPSPYKNIPTSVVGQAAHVKQSLDAARQVREREREKRFQLCVSMPISLFSLPLLPHP